MQAAEAPAPVETQNVHAIMLEMVGHSASGGWDLMVSSLVTLAMSLMVTAKSKDLPLPPGAPRSPTRADKDAGMHHVMGAMAQQHQQPQH